MALDPNSAEGVQARRERDAARKEAEVNARIQQLAEAADPGGDHPDVLVIKRDELAAKAEQARLDIAKEAAAKQSPQPPPPVPPTEGTLPAEFNPSHPEVPNALGSAPHSPGTPAGPMDEDVLYVTDDINADGTPLIQGTAQGFVSPDPSYDGESDRRYTDVIASGHKWEHSPAAQVGSVDEDDNLEPVINSHSEEGARLDALKLGRPVIYVPNEATLDPIANDPAKNGTAEGVSAEPVLIPAPDVTEAIAAPASARINADVKPAEAPLEPVPGNTAQSRPVSTFQSGNPVLDEIPTADLGRPVEPVA